MGTGAKRIPLARKRPGHGSILAGRGAPSTLLPTLVVPLFGWQVAAALAILGSSTRVMADLVGMASRRDRLLGDLAAEPQPVHYPGEGQVRRLLPR